MIGALVGHFRVEEKLGEGGMGVVYRARDEKLHRMVALKFLPAEWAADPTARARLLREARAAALLTHRNVATVYEVGEAADQVFMAMELIEGRSLRAVLQVRQRSLAEALRIAIEMVRGVAKAHETGIVHRDLKPENVMLTDEGEVKVLDFGLARQLHPVDVGQTKSAAAVVTRIGEIVGTPAYMSPEQATARPVDARSDVFSLGLILYELMTGRHPFRGDSALEVAAAIVRDDAARASSVNAEVTPALDRILATCLAKSPRDRYSTARDLLRDLESLTNEGASAPMLPSAERSTSRRPRNLVVGLAVGLVALVAAAVWFRRSSRSTRASGELVVGSVENPASPKSSNPEAVRVYLEGLHADQEGRRKAAVIAYTRALALDPSLAPALLRLTLRGLAQNMGPSDEVREDFRRVLASRASLNEHDQAWLDAWEPVMQRDPADQSEAIRRLRAALGRFPNDRQIAQDLAGLICKSPDIPPEARIAEAKAAGVGPDSLADVVACTNDDLGQEEEGVDGHDPCGRTPTDLTCLSRHATNLADQGKCAESEAVARRMLTLDPVGLPVRSLATALLGQRGQEDSVRELLRKWSADSVNRRLWGEIAVATVIGDFTTVIERQHALDERVKDARAEKDHAESALRLATVLEEIGKPRDAALVARSFLARRAAYEPHPDRSEWAVGMDPTGILLAIERRAGSLSPERYREQLQARLDWWDRRLGKTSWLRYAVWETQYAVGVETAAEAREALAARARFGRTYNVDRRSLGRTHLLAGMVDEALPELEQDAKSCEFVYGDHLQHTRSWFFLGEARVIKGDRKGACEAYGHVLERWGNAKPRSVTAERARNRMKELRCGS